ncbi:MAG TPA: M57 family metalloprotease [Ferruginibacter sp.]|nr:M57 family metalloprotease [Ferruginibacter sp.]
MKLFSRILAGLACVSILTISCKRENATPANPIPESVIAQIAAKGFSTENVQKVDNGYLVEGDIVLTEKNLTEQTTSPYLNVANEEQYRTTNLVTGLPRTISISVGGTLTGLTVWSNATNDFIARYNALGLQITLQRVASGGQVNIVGFNQGPSGGFITLGSSGFPSGGNPYPEIKMNTNAQAYGTNPNQGYITSVLQHELGHCIGFRHTDYFSRSSCGKRKQNEGTAGIGAILIPGTPSTADPNSFMLACSNGTDRTFNSNDVIALNYLY